MKFWSFKWLIEFFQDSRDNLSVFTLTSLAAGAALIYTAVKEVNNKGTVQIEVIYSLFIIYCVSVISDQLLAMVIERGIWKTPPAPDTQITTDVTTDSVNVNPVTATVTTNKTPDTPDDTDTAPDTAPVSE